MNIVTIGSLIAIIIKSMAIGFALGCYVATRIWENKE
jgi:type III secretory pathway component EscT